MIADTNSEAAEDSRFTEEELDRLDWLGAHPFGFI